MLWDQNLYTFRDTDSLNTRDNTENITSSNAKFRWDFEEKLTDINITPELVRKHLLKLKRNKSPGPDNIGFSLLLDLCGYISEPLSSIFNMSIHLKQVPTDWNMPMLLPYLRKVINRILGITDQ